MHAINLDHVIPFYNPSNIPFSYNQSTRKSFNRGHTPKSKMSLKSRTGNNNNNHSGSLTSGKEISSPSSLSFEMIDESIEEPQLPQSSVATRASAFEQLASKRESVLYSLPTENYNDIMNVDVQSQITPDDGLYFDNYDNDLDYYPERIVEPEREDFPVNNAQQPDYAPKLDTAHLSGSGIISGQKSNKPKNAPTIRKSSIPSSSKSLAQTKKLSSSTIDLHSMDDTNGTTFGLAKKSLSSRNGSPTRNYSAFHNNNNSKLKRTEAPKETNHARNNRKITVQIMAKPPPRSKTSFDLRASSAISQHSLPHATSTMERSINSPSMPSQPRAYNASFNGNGSGSAEENAEISVLTAYHERVYQQLSTRYATLQLVRNSTRYDLHFIIKFIFCVQFNDI